MALRIITVPFDNERGTFTDNEINNFLLYKKLKSYRVQFFSYFGKPYWSIIIEY